MGTQDIRARDAGAEGEEHRRHMRRLLNDLAALERMLESNVFETGVRRMGAEQELVLVDKSWHAAPRAVEILDELQDDRVTPEIGRFNLEFNLDPHLLTGSCLSTLEEELQGLIAKVRGAAHRHDAEVLLVGILPTMGLDDLGLDNIFPRPRYTALNDVIKKLRGSDFMLKIKGIDELAVQHPTVMLEALNTSFQLHFQTSPAEFPAAYNLSQALAAPVLAGSVNSPVLFGKRLWRETRIAIFQQVVDTRADAPPERDLLSRVRFGEGWVEKCITEIFRNDVARFRVFFGVDEDEDALELLKQGTIPKLKALQTHNSTVYRWNRACYGVTDGKPHLRIENRVFPAGPTVVDEVANAAFWFGLMQGGLTEWPDLKDRMEFDDAKQNFTSAARDGLASQLTWLDATVVPADRLILDTLLPVARDGLKAAGIDDIDADRYLGIIQDRVASKKTGAQWMLSSVAAMKGRGTRGERLSCLTSSIFRHQQQGDPVHTWPLAHLGESGAWQDSYRKVEQYMTTDLFTVHEDELIDLVASIMDWERIRHIPVEDEAHRLVGLVSYRTLLRLLAKRTKEDQDKPIAVRDVMAKDPITATPNTDTLEAIKLMRDNRVSCLPITKDGLLVGIVTEHDLILIAGKLLETALQEGVPSTQ